MRPKLQAQRRLCRPAIDNRQSAIGNSSLGFTLVEMLLVIAILALMLGLALGTLSGTLQDVQLKESANRLAALLRSARAEAANTGCQFRLAFDAQTGKPQLTYEPEPLTAPGQFQPYVAWWVQQAALDPSVKIASCQPTGAMGLAAPDSAVDQAASPYTDICFYPDGGSDSARLLLTCTDPDQPWNAEIVLNGVDGTITTRELKADGE
jgi:prepilin-type N-terminal cleavage/methylation domain-containing protein